MGSLLRPGMLVALIVGTALSVGGAAVPAAPAGGGAGPALARNPAEQDYGIELPGATDLPLSGVREGDACWITWSGTGPPAGWITVGIERSYDPVTCETVLAVASYRRDEVPSTVLPRVRDLLPAGAGGQSEPTFHAAVTARVVDSDLVVTSTTSWLEWSGATCVVSAAHRWEWYHVVPGGWDPVNASKGQGWSCQRAYTNAWAQFHGNASCSGDDGQVRHYTTYIEGRPGGDSYWQYSLAKSHECSRRLHYEFVVHHG